MNKVILGTLSAVALFGVAACSDSSDSTTTQSVTPPAQDQTMQPSTTAPSAAPAPTDSGGAAGTGGASTAPAPAN
jgi:hypothetical protein